MTDMHCMRALLVLAMVGLAPQVSAQESPHGALAVDEAQGYSFGFAHDHPNQVVAEKRAMDECASHGGQGCRVVLSWAGSGCGAYRSVTRDGFVYGWGVSGTRADAEAIADRELSERSNGRLADNRAWACNAGTDAMAILVQEKPKATATGPKTFLDSSGDPYEYTGPERDGKPHGTGTATGPKTFFDRSGDPYQYTGPERNGKPHGTGTAIYENGDRYEGGFVDGKMQGRGIYSWTSGARYEGEWFDDEMQGQGKYRFRNGKVYVGELRGSKMHGYGRYYETDGSLSYEGQWRDGQRAE